MRCFLRLLTTCVLFLTVGLSTLVSAQDNAEQSTEAPSIQGTYKLVKRELPDGKGEVPPVLIGVLTYAADYRNFNIFWKDSAGKVFSIAYVATYELTQDEYSEKSLYYMVNDEIGGTGLSYDLSGPSGKSPVKIEGSRIEFKLPLHNEPVVIFEGDKFTATREGEFVDHWEKVD